MKKLITICLAIVLFCSAYALAGIWTTINMPGAGATNPYGISGSNIAGQYYDAAGYGHGFIYNGITWTTLDAPGSQGMIFGTCIYDVDGSNFVGAYRDASDRKIHGFLYNGTSWTTLNKPGAFATYVCGIDGINLVGWYEDNSATNHGFFYDGTNWTTLDAPNAKFTHIQGIDGTDLVGWYGSYQTGHGFLYNGITWNIIDGPALPPRSANIQDIDGGNIVGYYIDGPGHHHGLLYDGTSWTVLDKPGASWTEIYGIDGDYLVGTNGTQGFIYTIPEPATLLLLGLGVVMVRIRGRREDG